VSAQLAYSPAAGWSVVVTNNGTVAVDLTPQHEVFAVDARGQKVSWISTLGLAGETTTPDPIQLEPGAYRSLPVTPALGDCSNRVRTPPTSHAEIHLLYRQVPAGTYTVTSQIHIGNDTNLVFASVPVLAVIDEAGELLPAT